MNDKWKEIEGYEGYYMINPDGVVKSLERYVKQGNHLRYVPGRIKGISSGGTIGYPCVTLCKNRKSRAIPIHILLARAFLPNPENKPFVDHINTDRSDYRLENLRWVTARENANNPLTLKHYRENTYTKEVKRRALKTRAERGGIGAPIRVYQYTKLGAFVSEYNSMEEAYRETGVYPASIKRALDDNTQSAGNYLWASSPREGVAFKHRIPPHSRAIIQFDKEGNFIREWRSITEAARGLGLHPSNIRRNIRQDGKPRKYMFRYKE